MKNTIPLKQFDIYFDGRKKLPKRSDGSYLFRTSERGEKSTVAVKTAELKLFTTPVDKNERLATDSIEEENAGNRTRTMILLAIIAAGLVAVFTIFLPKLVNTPDGSKPTR